MNITEEVQARAEEIQKDANDYITQIMKSKRGNKLGYDNLLVVWTYTKLAELELRIKELENKQL